jgi:heparan-alpha-glucosaminide N-acetyltransferase
MSSAPAAPPQRVLSIDAFRGLVMFLMLAEVMRLPQVARSFPDSWLWQFIRFHTGHVEWTGCSLHDLIQPGFSFLVGVALPYSIASRMARGQGFEKTLFHAVWRALILIFLGIFLRSLGRPQTNFTFEDTLTQIGLGYPFLFLLGFRSRRLQIVLLVVILVGYWAAFAIYPAPGPDFDYAAVGVPPDWPHHYSGFAAHWNKNSNLAWAFDRWFLNLFPRQQPFEYQGGGYATLSFIPTLGTMILGLLAGGVLRGGGEPVRKLRTFLLAGVGLLAAGWLLDATGICPNVKRIWTPAFTLYSGGWVFLILAGLYGLTDFKGWRRWCFPLVVIGMNSIAIYVMSWTMRGFFLSAVDTHLGTAVSAAAGETLAPVWRGAGVMAILWLILYWMYRRKIFLRI